MVVLCCNQSFTVNVVCVVAASTYLSVCYYYWQASLSMIGRPAALVCVAVTIISFLSAFLVFLGLGLV
jgi:hypothetical protein